MLKIGVQWRIPLKDVIFLVLSKTVVLNLAYLTSHQSIKDAIVISSQETGPQPALPPSATS